MTEAEVQQIVTDALTAAGWRWVHFRPAQAKGGRWLTPYSGSDGFPDIVAVKDHRMLVLECKSTKGAKPPSANVKSYAQIKLRKRYMEQAKWLLMCRAAGAYAEFVTPDTLDEVLREIADD